MNFEDVLNGKSESPFGEGNKKHDYKIYLEFQKKQLSGYKFSSKEAENIACFMSTTHPVITLLMWGELQKNSYNLMLLHKEIQWLMLFIATNGVHINGIEDFMHQRKTLAELGFE